MRVVIDTNTLIRFFSNDIPRKADAVEKLLKQEKQIFIPDVVFPELGYILINQHNFTREKLQQIFRFLNSQYNINITKEAKIAISIFEQSKLDMADCIIAAYALKGRLASFDKKLLKIKGMNPFWK